MDMPDDTPRKNQPIGNQQDECFEPECQQSFSSFDSNNKQIEGSASSIDQKGFKNMHTYKEKPMVFPEVPGNLGKLYQIYMYNVNRKRELKSSIEQLISQQIKSLRVAYDKETFSIQQFIDLDQQSQEYIISKTNYEQRQQELEKLTRKYKQLKIMQVQSMMILDATMKSTLEKFILKNKQVIFSYVLEDTVTILCKQKYKPKKIRGHRGKAQKKVTKKAPDTQIQEAQQQISVTNLEKPNKSKTSSNHSNVGTSSQNASEDEQDSKQVYKYVVRHFQFYKTQNGTSFQPLDMYLELPPGRQYIGMVICPFTKQCIVYDQVSLIVLDSAQRQLKMKWQHSFDSPIIFSEILKSRLYVGTKDGVMRVYDIRQNVTLSLNKIVYCMYGNPGQITHYALTNNPDIIIFVKHSTHLCEMNLNSYSSYLLSQLPEPVLKIDQRIIVTQSCFYGDYYIGGSNHGKVSLQHNNKLYGLSKRGNVVKWHKHENFDYLIWEEGAGIFVVESQ